MWEAWLTNFIVWEARLSNNIAWLTWFYRFVAWLEWPGHFNGERRDPLLQNVTKQINAFSHVLVSVSVCSSPLVRRLNNAKITASSEYNGHHAAWLGRLGRIRRGPYVGAWCARHNNHNQWIKFDFSRPMRITKVDTQGRHDADQWVTRFQLSSSLDGIHWQIYRFKSQDKVCEKRSVSIF